MRSPSAVRVTLLGLLATCQGCTYASDEADTAGLIAGRPQTFELASTSPAAGASDVSPNSPIDLVFSVPPDSDTVNGASVRVFAGLIETLGYLQVDLLDQRIRFTPPEPLRPRLRHQVYVHRSLAGLNGARLVQTIVFNFTTGAEDRLPPPPPPAAVDPAAVQAVWDRHCSSCHRPPGAPDMVDLSSPQAARLSLRGAPSAYAGRLRVDPGSHASSYLMLKLLGVGGFLGFPMPPAGPTLPRDTLRQIASWIDEGAP
jgi:mono/diheme cytochrome c family protein